MYNILTFYLYSDTKKASLKWEYDYKKSEEEREVMETSIETLRSSMAKSESKKKQLQEQVRLIHVHIIVAVICLSVSPKKIILS